MDGYNKRRMGRLKHLENVSRIPHLPKSFIRKIEMKPRNHVILAMLKMGRKTLVHQKTNKAERRKDKVNINKEI